MTRGGGGGREGKGGMCNVFLGNYPPLAHSVEKTERMRVLCCCSFVNISWLLQEMGFATAFENPSLSMKQPNRQGFPHFFKNREFVDFRPLHT